MVRKIISKDFRRAFLESRKLIEIVMKTDGNEAETRRRVERIFEILLGYNALEHLSRERAVKGAGETEHVDFAVQLKPGIDVEPVMMVELKRVGVDLALKHLKQVTSYAIDSGCEWVLLTNGRDWRLYHVEFGQPPKTQLVEYWNLLTDDATELAAKIEILKYKNVKKGSLKELWERTIVLSSDNLLAAIVSKDCLKVLCKILRKNTGVMIAPKYLINGLRKLLNENAAIELSKIKIDSLQKKKKIQKSVKIEQSAIQEQILQKCDGCGKDIEKYQLVKIDSGQELCPECINNLKKEK
jgi:hypothetical protein